MKRLTNHQTRVVRRLIGTSGHPMRPEAMEEALRAMRRIAVAGWLIAAAWAALAVFLAARGGVR
jgi:hypothetical protein